MEVFEFKKSFHARQLEAQNILNGRGVKIPASEVRKKWSLCLEMAIEPSGWQALWRISRVFCEDLSLKFPTIVTGTVEDVLFDDLKAIFVVEYVQDDDVQLPARQIVPLIELWPLKEQKDENLVIDRTAEYIDQLRFFFQHIWFPWDNQDDNEQVDWASQHLQNRIKFYCDLKNKTMKSRLSSHITGLLTEARYLQTKRELLEMETEGEDDEDLVKKAEVLATNLLKIHLRMNEIKNNIDYLESSDPRMREIYDEVRFSNEKKYFPGSVPSNKGEKETFIVSLIGSMDHQIEYLSKAKSFIGHEKLVRIADSLQNVLNSCNGGEEIYIPPGKHLVKLPDDLSSDESIRAINSNCFLDDKGVAVDTPEDVAVICSRDDDCILLSIAGDCCFENIMFDCTNVRNGVVVKAGNVSFKNCCFVGDPKPAENKGLVLLGSASVSLEQCLIKDFSAGIHSNQTGQIVLNKCVIQNCMNGIEVAQFHRMTFDSSKIIDCKNYAIILGIDDDIVDSQPSFESSERVEFRFVGACTFANNKKGNVFITIGFNGDYYFDTSDNEVLNSELRLNRSRLRKRRKSDGSE